jgi:hypothetical protein
MHGLVVERKVISLSLLLMFFRTSATEANLPHAVYLLVQIKKSALDCILIAAAPRSHDLQRHHVPVTRLLSETSRSSCSSTGMLLLSLSVSRYIVVAKITYNLTN